MNAPPRHVAMIDKDLMSVCRRIGAVAVGAELSLQPPNIADLEHASQGLAAVLRERRAATAAKESRQ